MTVPKVLKDHMSVEQLILLEVYKKKGKPTTIDELINELNLPRTTLAEHIGALERDGFFRVEKEGRIKKFFPVPEVHEKIMTSLAQLRSMYVYALDNIHKRELKQLEQIKEEEKQ